MADTPRPTSRPLSPHLTVFRPSMTMIVSIVHRITGVANYFGMLLLAWWLLAAASGPEAYRTAQAFFGSPIGWLVLFGYTWSVIHHWLGGIRYLVWDTGRGLDKPMRDQMAWGNVIGSVTITILLWIAVLVAR
jgi:succinate dehydrogenase / fumarate reductase cytochrome b subunit